MSHSAIDAGGRNHCVVVIIDHFLNEEGLPRLLMIGADDAAIPAAVQLASPMALDLSAGQVIVWEAYVRHVMSTVRRPPMGVLTRMLRGARDVELRLEMAGLVSLTEVGLALLEKRRDLRSQYHVARNTDLAIACAKLTRSWERAYDDFRNVCEILLAGQSESEKESDEERAAFSDLLKTVDLVDRFDQAVLSIPANAAIIARHRRSQA